MEFNGKKLYSEEVRASSEYKKLYDNSIAKYIERKRTESAGARAAFMPPDSLAKDPEKFRRLFDKMLGAPLCDYSVYMPLPVVRSEYLASDDMGTIYRVMFEIFEDFTFYGLMFFPKDFDEASRYPLVISQHGGSGSPELCSDFYFETNYTNMTRRILEYNAVVFAPQLLLWNPEMFGVAQNRQLRDNQLKQLGGSITALEVFCIKRCIDYFVKQAYINEDKIGMIGLSYGGFYTLMAAASDTRIKSAYSSCYYNDSFILDWPDWIWNNSANTFKNAETAALIAPRRLYIEAGIHDDRFPWRAAQTECERLVPFYEAQNAADNLRFKIFEGDHMLDRDNSGITFFMQELT